MNQTFCSNLNILSRILKLTLQDNRDTMDNNGPALLTQLWEYHLVKVQSYHSDHSVQALRAYAATCQRHLQQSNRY